MRKAANDEGESWNPVPKRAGSPAALLPADGAFWRICSGAGRPNAEPRRSLLSLCCLCQCSLSISQGEMAMRIPTYSTFIRMQTRIFQTEYVTRMMNTRVVRERIPGRLKFAYICTALIVTRIYIRSCDWILYGGFPFYTDRATSSFRGGPSGPVFELF